MVDLNRRGFLGNLLFSGLGLYTGVEASDQEINQTTTPIPNPFQTYVKDLNEFEAPLETLHKAERELIMGNDILRISANKHFRYVEPLVPMTGQVLYSLLKEYWKITPELIIYPFPMTALTPEMFQMEDEWEIVATNNIRDCGILDGDKLYYGVSVLSQEGVVYDSHKVRIANGGLMRSYDGKVSGFYSKHHTDKLVELSEVFQKTIDITEVTHQLYRIV